MAIDRIIFSMVANRQHEIERHRGRFGELSLIRSHAKYALNASGITDGDLDVSFFLKFRTRVHGFAFGEHAFESIDRGLFLRFENGVQVSNDGTVKISPQLILAV